MIGKLSKSATKPSVQLLTHNFILIVFLYFYIYQPPLINKIYYIAAEISILLLFAIVNFKFIKRYITIFRIEIILVLSIIFISMARDLFSGEIIYFDRFAAWGVQAFIFPCFIIYLVRKNNIDLIGLIYWSSLCGALLTLLLILFPAVDNYYKSIQLDSYYDIYGNFELRYRAYGISENLSFTYGYIMGIFAGYSLLMTQRKLYFIIPVVLFLIAAAFNARIGFISFSIFLMYFLISIPLITNLKIGTLVIALISSIMLSNIDITPIMERIQWSLEFFDVVYTSLFTGEATGAIKTITTDFIILPSTASDFLFGSGESLYLKENMNTDIGFLLQLNYAGIIIITPISIFILYTSKRIIRNLGGGHWYTPVFIFSLLFLNTKGFLFAATPGGRVIFLIYIYFIYRQYEKRFKNVF